MGGSKGTATTVVDRLPGYVKKFVYSGTYNSKGELDWNQAHGDTGYLPWAESLAKAQDNDELWRYKDDNGNDLPTYAGQETYELEGISKLADRGRYGDLLVQDKVIPYIENVLDGNYLTGTRAEFITMLDQVIDKPKETLNNILDEIGTSLYVVGDLSNDNLAKTSVDDSKYYDRIIAFTKVQNYKSERRRQEHAIGYGIEYGKQAVIDAETLRMAGLYQREYKQSSYIDTYKKTYDKLVTRVRRLEILGNAVRSLVGSQEATTKPYYKPSPVVGILGGAMAGASAGAMIGSGPTGAVIGAVAGAILGGLSSA